MLDLRPFLRRRRAAVALAVCTVGSGGAGGACPRRCGGTPLPSEEPGRPKRARTRRTVGAALPWIDAGVSKIPMRDGAAHDGQGDRPLLPLSPRSW